MFTILVNLLRDRLIVRFLFGIVLGLSFSMAVILSTIGIMDGFDKTLKSAMKEANGSFTIFSKDGFFNLNNADAKKVLDLGATKVSTRLQTEAFLTSNDLSLGVLVIGVDDPISGILVNVDEIVVGEGIYKKLFGEEFISIAFPRGNEILAGMPLIKRFKVRGSIDHKIYEKNERIVYISKRALDNLLDAEGKVTVDRVDTPSVDDEALFLKIKKGIEEIFTYPFRVRPYTYEFSGLFEAIRIEKRVITLVLQVIVLIAAINLLAFLFFINEKKAVELFLYQALGLSKRRVKRALLSIGFLIWALAVLMSMVLLDIFSYLLKTLKIFQIPGEVYKLTSLSLSISLVNYVIVYAVTFLWILIVGYLGLKREFRSNIIEGIHNRFG